MINKETIIKNSVRTTVYKRGVYFLINQFDDIVYIGQTSNLYARINVHKNNSKLVFGRYYFIDECSTGKALTNKELDDLEKNYIKKYKPIYNFKDNPDYDNDKRKYFRLYFKSSTSMTKIAKNVGVTQPFIKNILLEKQKCSDKILDKIIDEIHSS